ncbi:MAG: ATP synthase F0 subunit B [Planctomycetaceae bacterium]|nr:ATP synthase F0 subunit B [Gemmataceae bacterium]PHX64160.1 MAG: ATP synthase F0 subunit B [Planctomycetaceae bacterium]
MLRRFIVMTLIGLLSLAFVFSTNCFAEVKTAEANTAEAKVADSKQPEEQRDIFGFSADTGVWTLVLFILLFFALKKTAWAPMLEGLQKREENIRRAIDEAEAASLKSQKLQSELDAKFRLAGDQIRLLIDEARRDGQVLKDEMVSKAKEEIVAERDRLHRELQLAKDQAMKELLTKASDLALLVSSKAIKKSLTIDDHRGLVDDCLAELSK